MLTLLRTSAIARRVAAGSLVVAAFSAPAALASLHPHVAKNTTVAMRNCDWGGADQCNW
jgi:hypothetical protein